MSNNELMSTLLNRLDAPLPRYETWRSYLEGHQPISFLSPEAREALGDRMSHLSINVPSLMINAVAERLRVTGFDGVDISAEWSAAGLDQQAPALHREALAYGDAYAIVWGDGNDRPTVSVESPRRVTTLSSPSTGIVTAAAKRYSSDTTTELFIYLPDRVDHYRADTTGATVGGFRLVESIDHDLGVVPVVRFRNGHRLDGSWGWSEMSDVLSLTDALTKLTADMLVSSEYTARPRRWATGLELTEDDDGNPVNPISENGRLMINEDSAGKFGQLPGSDLSGYQNAINVVMRQISAVSGLPEHLLGIGGDNPTSADSIRASEAALTARAEARQASFGRSWEQVAQLLVAIRDNVSPFHVNPRVIWADPSTRSEAQAADAVVKLYQAGIIGQSTALRRLGYGADEIQRIQSERRADSLSSIDLGALSNG